MKSLSSTAMLLVHWALKLSLALLAAFTLLACDMRQSSLEAQQVEAPAAATDYSDYLHRDIRDDVFYFVMPDRFENGDPGNDQGSKTIAVSRGGFDPTNTGYYHGGDLLGLQSRLDYLQDMGITAIWLTPILRNMAVQGDSAGYHGYWILDFTELDPHLGTNTELKTLIDKAHQRDIKVFFDIITNHTADVIKFKECHHPDGSMIDEENPGCEFKSAALVASGEGYTPFVPESSKDVKVPAWLNDPHHYHNQGDTTWEGESVISGDFFGLDDLDSRSEEVVTGFIEIYKNILSEFKPDGFRIDTVKHVEMSFWKRFTPAITDHARALGIPNFHVFGEVYDANEDPLYLSRYTTLGNTPAVLDFAFQSIARNVMVKGQSPQQLSKLFDDDDYYNDADSSAALLSTFTGTHDMGRIGMFLNQDTPDASDGEKLRRSVLIHALMYFSRGIPIIYYGDEQGFTGDGNDRGAREDMMPSRVDSYNDNKLLATSATTAISNFDKTHPLYQIFSEFSDTYKAHRPLRRGIHLNRFADDAPGIYAFSRIDPDDPYEYLLVFNSDTQSRTVTLAATAERYSPILGAIDDLVASEGEVTIHLAPLAFAIYRAESIMPITKNLNVTVVQAGRDKDPRADNVIAIDYRVDAETETPVPLLKVTTEIMREDGKYHIVAHDFTPPYRARLQGEISNAEQRNYKIRVTVDNLRGQKHTEEYGFSI